MSISKNETNRERFKRIATQRTNNILERIRILGNCANTNFYEYNEEDVNKIFNIIDQELKDVKGKFKVRRGRKFTL